MCSKATCRACGKTTWAGCGQHVPQVMARVPRAEQCTCTDAERQAVAGARGGWLSALLGR